MAFQTKNDLERADLQADVPSTSLSLHDLREMYYKGEIGIAGTADRQESELIRSFLQLKTGVTNVQSLHDLWVMYLVSQGVTQQVSLSDMMRSFFAQTGNLPALGGTTHGSPVGVLLSITN